MVKRRSTNLLARAVAATKFLFNAEFAETQRTAELGLSEIIKIFWEFPSHPKGEESVFIKAMRTGGFIWLVHVELPNLGLFDAEKQKPGLHV